MATIGQTLFEPTVGERRELGTVRLLLSRHSRLYALASTLSRRLSARGEARVKSREFASTWRSLTPKRRTLASAYDGDDWRTILTPLYRGEVVDYRDPRIEAGLAVIRASLARIAGRCRETGTRLVVVFIPTKENVFAGRIHHLEAHAPLSQLAADEEALKRTLIGDLEDLNVRGLDLLAPLRAARTQPYFEDLDGHPNAAGHETIAAELDRILQEDLISARSR